MVDYGQPRSESRSFDAYPHKGRCRLRLAGHSLEQSGTRLDGVTRLALTDSQVQCRLIDGLSFAEDTQLSCVCLWTTRRSITHRKQLKEVASRQSSLRHREVTPISRLNLRSHEP